MIFVYLIIYLIVGFLVMLGFASRYKNSLNDSNEMTGDECYSGWCVLYLIGTFTWPVLVVCYVCEKLKKLIRHIC